MAGGSACLTCFGALAGDQHVTQIKKDVFQFHQLVQIAYVLNASLRLLGTKLFENDGLMIVQMVGSDKGGGVR